MFKLFSKRAREKRETPPDSLPSGPAGQRGYIIGDVHGCLNELVALLRLIKEDVANSPAADNYIVFLGDLIDRGPSSAHVLELLRQYKPDFATPVFLKGNHEELFLKILEGRMDLLESWFRFGGRDCARSYGVDNLGSVFLNPEQVIDNLIDRVPQSHIDFQETFATMYEFGDFVCVHAGILPKTKLADQKDKDLMWIREPFLSYKKPHEKVVIHGHTIVEEPEFFPNRIAIDTGAYKSGVLACLRIDGEKTSLIKTASPT